MQTFQSFSAVFGSYLGIKNLDEMLEINPLKFIRIISALSREWNLCCCVLTYLPVLHVCVHIYYSIVLLHIFAITGARQDAHHTV